MNRAILSAALAAGCFLASAAPATAAAKNYDCTKAGNANKAACKGAAKSATAAAASATPAKPAAAAVKPTATHVSSTTTTRTVTQKNYDCTKRGNANKAVCKSATPAAPAATQTTVAISTRHYDCTKPGNANRQECKVSTAATQTTAQPTLMQRMKNAIAGTSAPTAKPAPAARRAAAPRNAAATSASVEDHNPAGAIAQCKDGTYSHAKGRTGACSRHGGVAKWM